MTTIVVSTNVVMHKNHLNGKIRTWKQGPPCVLTHEEDKTIIG